MVVGKYTNNFRYVVITLIKYLEILYETGKPFQKRGDTKTEKLQNSFTYVSFIYHSYK